MSKCDISQKRRRRTETSTTAMLSRVYSSSFPTNCTRIVFFSFCSFWYTLHTYVAVVSLSTLLTPFSTSLHHQHITIFSSCRQRENWKRSNICCSAMEHHNTIYQQAEVSYSKSLFHHYISNINIRTPEISFQVWWFC